MGKIIFITGGARSGKSSFALNEASKLNGKKAYVATAEPLDEEMKIRIHRHRKYRGTEWDTYEEPLEVARVLRKLNSCSVILIDCLTIWLSNVMLGEGDIETKTAELISALNDKKKTHQVFVVSNEVGMGIVPDNETARRFRDLAGALNQKVAEIADDVYLVVSGIPVKIKAANDKL